MALEVAGSLSSKLSDPLGVSFADLYQSIQDLIAGDVEKVVMRLVKAAFVDFDLLGKALDCIDFALNAPIEIPFVSKLYKWITGEQLTLLDVTCLALAIPTHMGYAIYTVITTGHARRFADDAKELMTQQLTAGHVFGETQLLRSGSAEANAAHNRAMHWSYFVFYEFYTFGSGGLKAAQIFGPQGEWKKSEGTLAIVPGVVLNGLVSKTLLYTAGMKEEGWNDFDQGWNSSLYGALVGFDLLHCARCVCAWRRSGDDQVRQVQGRGQADGEDWFQYLWLRAAGHQNRRLG